MFSSLKGKTGEVEVTRTAREMGEVGEVEEPEDKESELVTEDIDASGASRDDLLFSFNSRRELWLEVWVFLGVSLSRFDLA